MVSAAVRFITILSPVHTMYSGQNSIVYVGGAQDSLTGEDIVSLSALFKKSKLFVPNFECQPDALLSGLRVAKQFGGKVCQPRTRCACEVFVL